MHINTYRQLYSTTVSSHYLWTTINMYWSPSTKPSLGPTDHAQRIIWRVMTPLRYVCTVINEEMCWDLACCDFTAQQPPGEAMHAMHRSKYSCHDFATTSCRKTVFCWSDSVLLQPCSDSSQGRDSLVKCYLSAMKLWWFHCKSEVLLQSDFFTAQWCQSHGDIAMNKIVWY